MLRQRINHLSFWKILFNRTVFGQFLALIGMNPTLKGKFSHIYFLLLQVIFYLSYGAYGIHDSDEDKPSGNVWYFPLFCLPAFFCKPGALL